MFDFESKPPYWVNRLAFLVRSELQHEFRKAGYELTPEEWALLMVLWQRSPLSVGNLADLTLRDRTTVTRLLDGLEHKGFVERSSDAEDRRRLNVSVTTAGRSLSKPLSKLANGLIRRSTKGVSEKDIANCMATLQAMVKNLS